MVAALSIVVIMTFCYTFMFPYRPSVHNLTNYLNILPTDVFKEEQASKEERATDAILN